MSSDEFSLVWNSFPRNLSSGLYNLLTDEQLVDVTLAVEGQILRAHKLILSVCSTYFKELFKMNSCKHPIVILKDVNYRDLSAMLHFMYQGEVNVKQEDLASFLKVAETLQIKGLTRDKNEKDDGSVTKENPSRPEVNSEESCANFDSFSITDAKPETRDEELSAQGSPQLVTKEFFHSKAPDQDQETTLPTIEPDSIMQEISSTGSEDNEQRISRPAKEPLDYTSDIGRSSKTKNEGVDYTSDIDLDVLCDKNYPRQDNITDNKDSTLNPEKTNDCYSNSQLSTSCNPVNRDEPLPSGHLEASSRKDFPYELFGSCSRGRKTVKGIPGSSLPLATTLQVVSDLGPTLRVERGKVFRMYSCPWCLRHFTRKENLKLHVRCIHGPLESLTCKLCGNKYKNSNSLRVHSYLYHNTRRNKHSKLTLVNNGI